MSIVADKVMQAHSLLSRGEALAALATLQPLAARHGREPNVNSLMAVILYRLGRFPQALHFAQRAVEINPRDPDYWANLGLILGTAGNAEKSRGALEKAIELSPRHVEARIALAGLCMSNHDTAGAMAHCEAVLQGGWHPQVSLTYAGALSGAGLVDRANEFTRQALVHFPGNPDLLHGLCAGLNYSHAATVGEIAAAHRAYGEAILATIPKEKFDLNRPPTIGRPPRIGFVSGDLRGHSVAYFMEPFFEHYDKERLSLYVYSTTPKPDAVSQRLKGLVPHWLDCAGLVDTEIARRIEKDRIDVLVDLGGHTMSSSLSVFALKPAPVQATYCGYPNTTGLSTVDYRIVDSRTDPVANSAESARPDFDERCTEKLVRLDPCFLCYKPARDAPEIQMRGGEEGVVFGSFNANKKIGPEVIGLWARILEQVPGSRMLLKTFELKDAAARKRILERFATEGIAEGRIEIMPATAGIVEHLAMYGRVDVALDTIPYNGTTTTCEAFWMGVPVVSMAGATHAGRVGLSLLSVIGAPELVAPDESAYVSLACALAMDRARLVKYRASLREMMRGSALCNGPEFAARLGAAFMAMSAGRR